MASSFPLQISWKQPGIYLQEAGHQERVFFKQCAWEKRKNLHRPIPLSNSTDLIILETASKHSKQTKLQENQVVNKHWTFTSVSWSKTVCLPLFPKLVGDAEISMCQKVDSCNSPRMTKYHSQCFPSITCTVYWISALSDPWLPAHTSSDPERNT